jgi:acyl carrier protein
MPARDDVECRILAKAKELACEEYPPIPVQRATLLRAELGFTSLQAVNLILDLEDEFNVVIEESELAEVRTVGDIVDLVLSRIDRRPDAPA